MDGSFLLFYFTYFSNFFSFFFSPCLSFLCITPFPTYLESPLPEVTSCWAQVSPSDGSTHFIASGTQVPLPRERPLGINPMVISESVSLERPKVAQPTLCRSTFWNEGEWCWKKHPARSFHLAKYYPLLACMCLCSSDLSQSSFYLITWVFCPGTAPCQPHCFLKWQWTMTCGQGLFVLLTQNNAVTIQY